MKKQFAIKKAGSVRLLAMILNISTQAVHKWGKDIPQTSLSALQLLKPEWFVKPKD